MSVLWFWRYIPCGGVRLTFEQFDLYEKDGRAIVRLTRRPPNHKRKILQKHVQDDPGKLFKQIGEIDFEIALASLEGNGFFDLSYVHAFSFLLMIRTGGWISAPAILTHSILEEPEVDAPHIYCEDFIDATPAYFGDFKLTKRDAVWIKSHIDTALNFVKNTKFQNAMQALTSFHCIPYSGTCLLVAWSGLEALFGVEQEISFRLSLYIANYLKSGDARYPEFEKLRKSYTERSRVAHGAATKAKALDENAIYTRDILRACLKKCIETKEFPDSRRLTF